VHEEAEPGCAGDEQPCLLDGQPHWHRRLGKQSHLVHEAGGSLADPLESHPNAGPPSNGSPDAAQASVDRGEEADPRSPGQRMDEDTTLDLDDDADPRRPLTCQTDRPGWAGSYRHGAVRPRPRTRRRERPPRRWC
jgi:hypothetical protein